MSNIVIRELLASDTFSSLVDKVNYNFDQLLLAGGGPKGLTGSDGDIGPMGISGTRMFTVIDIVDRTSELPVNPVTPGDPNKYYPVAPGSTDKVGTSVKSLRHNDLYIEEKDDNSLGNSGLDGDIWIYSVITNSWVKTGNNIKGNVGNTGNNGLSQWSRDLTYQASGRDYLYVTDITGVDNHKLVLGAVSTITEVGTPTVDSESIINIITDTSSGAYARYAISMGDASADATQYAKITAYSGILYLKAPEYGGKNIQIDADNKITLNGGTNIIYEINNTVLGAQSHHFSGAPVQVSLGTSTSKDYFRVSRDNRSALVIYPTTSASTTDRINLYSVNATINPVDNTMGTKELVIRALKVGIGNVSNNLAMGARMNVLGNMIIGEFSTAAYSTEFFQHDPGHCNLAVWNKIGIGTRYSLEITGTPTSDDNNKFGSKLVIANRSSYGSRPTTNTTILLQQSLNNRYAVTGLYMQAAPWNGSYWKITKQASLLYNPYYNQMRIAVDGHPNTIFITNEGNVAIDYQMSTPYKLAVNGTVRFLANNTNALSGLEILSDELSTLGATDTIRPIRRGIVIGRNDSGDNYGLFNFYKHSRQNTSYNLNGVFPNYSDVDSSRFNFRSYDQGTDVAFSILSLRGYSHGTIAAQIGSEYPLSIDRTAPAPERSNFDNVGLHVRKFTSAVSTSLNNTATGLLLQNDVFTLTTLPSGQNTITDIDFYTTKDGNSKTLGKINVPQARIRFKTNTSAGTASTEGLNSGNLEFYTSYPLSTVFGNNALRRTMLLDWEGNVTIDNNLTVNGTVTFSAAALQDIWLGVGASSTESEHFIKGYPGTRVLIKGGDGYGSGTSQAGKKLILIGGEELGSAQNAGDVYIIGGGILSRATYLPNIIDMITPTSGNSYGGDVYISGGLAGTGRNGVIYLGLNPYNSSHTNIFIEASSTFNYPATFKSTIFLNNFVHIKKNLNSNYIFEIENDGGSGFGAHIRTGSAFSQTAIPLCISSWDGSTGIYWTVDGVEHSISDIRLKKDIVAIKNSINIVKLLNPITFTWKNGEGNLKSGFIAQEMLEVLPHVVHTGPNDFYYVNEKGIIPYIVAAVQEQQQIIEEKDKKIAELEERLAKIEKLLNI